MPWFLAAAAGLLAWLRVAWVGIRTDRCVDRLTAIPPDPPPGGWPALTVVVPARDEARGVEASVRSLLAQDYPELRVVAVDDRSTDGTGAILDRVGSDEPRLRVVHVGELPPGWLGKNHACASGADAASDGWLLFTDGDVIFAPGALRRAVAYAGRHGLGHLVALPRLVAVAADQLQVVFEGGALEPLVEEPAGPGKGGAAAALRGRRGRYGLPGHGIDAGSVERRAHGAGGPIKAPTRRPPRSRRPPSRRGCGPWCAPRAVPPDSCPGRSGE